MSRKVGHMPEDRFWHDIHKPGPIPKFLRDDFGRARKQFEKLKQWWGRRSHFSQAVLIGSAAFLFTLGFAELLWVRWVKYPPGTKAADEFGLQLDFFQTVATFAAAFVAGTLGWLAVQEFREEHKEAVLELSIPNAPEAMGEELFIMPGLHSTYFIVVRLQNIGATKAGFYTVRISAVFLY